MGVLFESSTLVPVTYKENIEDNHAKNNEVINLGNSETIKTSGVDDAQNEEKEIVVMDIWKSPLVWISILIFVVLLVILIIALTKI